MKKLTILIPSIAVAIFLAIAGTITGAGSRFISSSDSITISSESDSNEVNQELELARELMRDKELESAEAIYLKIVYENPGTPEALEAQRQLIRIAFFEKDQEKADVAFEHLITDFSELENISQVIFQTGRDYKHLNPERAMEIHRYNVTYFFENKYALWSQVEITKNYIADGNDLAQEETDYMITLFANQSELPKAIYKLGIWYNIFDNPEKALELYRYAAETYPSDLFGLWSQFKCDISDEYYETAREIFNSIVTTFADYEILPEEIYFAAMELQKNDVNEQSEIAFDLHQYNIDNYSDYQFWHVMFSQVEVTRYFINHEDVNEADIEFEILMTTFAKKPGLPAAILAVGDTYWDMAMLKYIGTGIDGIPNETSLWYFAKAIEKYELIINQYNSARVIPEAYFAAAEGYRMFNDSMKALEYYEHIVTNWPDYPKSPMALVKIARTYDNLANRNEFPKEDADLLIKDAYERIVMNYPQTREAIEAKDWLNHRNPDKDGIDPDLPENIRQLIERFEK